MVKTPGLRGGKRDGKGREERGKREEKKVPLSFLGKPPILLKDGFFKFL